MSAYHPQANRIIERKHKPIVDALSKMLDDGSTNWMRNLPVVFWADRSTVRTSTGPTPYYINCGIKPVLLIEFKILTWRSLPWNKVHTISKYLAMRARQLQRQNKDVEEATFHLQRIRLERKECYDDKHSICVEELKIGQVILLYNTRRKKDISRKLSFKWLGLYRIYNAVKDKNTYIFEELDESWLSGTFASDKLKRFYPRQKLHLDHTSDLSFEELFNLDNFLLHDGNSNISDVPDDLSNLEYG